MATKSKSKQQEKISLPSELTDLFWEALEKAEKAAAELEYVKAEIVKLIPEGSTGNLDGGMAPHLAQSLRFDWDADEIDKLCKKFYIDPKTLKKGAVVKAYVRFPKTRKIEFK